MDCLILIDIDRYNLENDIVNTIVNTAIGSSCLIVEISKNPLL